MAQSIINKNLTQEVTQKYSHTCMVSHRGTPVCFAMREDGHIFYSVLDIAGAAARNSEANPEAANDKNSWSRLGLDDEDASSLKFPSELVQIGYGVLPNYKVEEHDKDNKQIVAKRDNESNPLDAQGNKISAQALREKTNRFYSTTAKFGTKTPFQTLSDGKYIYLFRQSISRSDVGETRQTVVNNTLLVDRFVLSGNTLKLGREIRYQRSRHRTVPQSRKDALAAVDVEGHPFYEPTRELAFVNNLSGGNFSVLLIPGADSEEQRWQIFAADSKSNKINCFNIKFDQSTVFDFTDPEELIDNFSKRHGLDKSDLASKIRDDISTQDGNPGNAKTDPEIVDGLFDFLRKYDHAADSDRDSVKDSLGELLGTVRTGVAKEDFSLTTTGEWPLIDEKKKGDYYNNGKLREEFAFSHGPSNDSLKPGATPFLPKNGLSACYYYQQEMGQDRKPVKNNACVMLALGLEDGQANKYLGVLNFAVSKSGRLSRPTVDSIDLPNINVQALDENRYANLDQLNEVKWQEPQKMELLDIDPRGLGTSGGVMKFAYTDADVGTSEGYSDAVEATSPHLFDDSLGRVNLYFKGRNNNFFVLYFNPTGSKSIRVSPKTTPPLNLKPRIDRGIKIEVAATTNDGANLGHETATCCLTMKAPNGSAIEEWNYLPTRYSQICSVLNGDPDFNLGTLEPRESTPDHGPGNTQHSTAGYVRDGDGFCIIKLRTSIDNNLLFPPNAESWRVDKYATHAEGLKYKSTYLYFNRKIRIADKVFELNDRMSVSVEYFHKSYLFDTLESPEEVDNVWEALINLGYLKRCDGRLDVASLQQSAFDFAVNQMSPDELESRLPSAVSPGIARSPRFAGLKQSLVLSFRELAKTRIVTLEIHEIGPNPVKSLEAGLKVSVGYDYSYFVCRPDLLGKPTIAKWEQNRSFLFHAGLNESEEVNSRSELTSDFNYSYDINNSIGQWEDWEASLAIELNPQSPTEGPAFTTTKSDHLACLEPTKKGLSAEVWVKPNKDFSSPGSLVFYKNDEHNYSLGIEKHSSGDFRCVATMRDKKFVTRKSFAIQEDGKSIWRHLAFTHKKYWGYHLGEDHSVNCSSDSSLALPEEFTIEVLVRIEQPGTILEKEGDYCLALNSNNQLTFTYGIDKHPVQSLSLPKNGLGTFRKITLIRSRNKPQTKPSKDEYELTGGRDDKSSKDKWYAKKDTSQITKGLAEKQDQMESSMKLSQANTYGNLNGNTGDEANPTYYHTIVVSGEDDDIEKTSSEAKEVEHPCGFKDFVIGGDSFSGTFSGIRVWNRALSISEAKNETVSENKTGLISHWRLSEGEGKHLYDSVSQNHGVASGGKWVDSPQLDQPGQFQFYVDGSPFQHSQPTKASANAEKQFSIGGIQGDHSGNFENHFHGSVEEIRVWNLPRTAEQITDNAFGRLKGESDQLLVNYTFDKPLNRTGEKLQDSSTNCIDLDVRNKNWLKEVLSTAPVATEIPQIRSALTGVFHQFNGTTMCRPSVVEYGDMQEGEGGTMSGVLKRCYSFIDVTGAWNRMTGYKIGNLVSQWYSQAQFAPQVMGYLEGPPPVPAENFTVVDTKDDVDRYAFDLDNSVNFHQAEEFSYNYSTSKEKGWNVGVESDGSLGVEIATLVAPLGIGFSFEGEASAASNSNWDSSSNRSECFERGTTVSTEQEFSAGLAGYGGKRGAEDYYYLGNTGYALVKSKTADIYLLRLAHNDALVSIYWKPNPDIPEDVNIVPFPINPFYVKQGSLDGKSGRSS